MSGLAITRLTVRFGGLTAVRDVGFTAAPGRILGLIGPNGAGKSTLLNCISGITRPSAGSIRLDGTELAGLSMHRIAARGIGRVFQHPELVAGFTALDTLRAGCHRDLHYGLLAELFALPAARRQEAAARHRALAALDAIGLAADADRDMALLPYGHRKLVDLARSLMAAPRFLLLDEPVAGLNDAEIDRLADMLRELRDVRGLGIVLVEHNMALVARLCDEVVVLDAGRVIAHDVPQAVLRDRAVMAAYLGEAPADA